MSLVQGIRSILISVVVLVALTACVAQQPQQPAVPGPTEAAEPAPETQQEPVVVLQGIDPTTLDPYFRTQIPENNVMLAVFDLLVMWDEFGNVVPHIATDWQLVDELTWEFKIREGVTAHNGEVIDANDVAYSFSRAVDPEVGAKGVLPWIFGNIQFDRAEVVDDYTVRIHTKAPIPDLPSFMKEMFIIPQDYYESTPLDEAARNPVGSGPFEFVEWRKGDRVIVEANKDYWAGAPEIQRVIWRAVPETGSRIAELNTGGADIIVNVPPDLADQIDPAYGRVVTVEGLRRIFIGYVFYGPNAEAIQLKQVRQALNYGIDFQKIIDSLLNGNGERTGTFANPPFQAPGVEPYPYDPEQAQELLSQVGYEDRDGDGIVEGPDGDPLTLTLQAPNGRYVKDLELAQAVAADLKNNIGVDVEVQPMEWSTFADQLASSQLTGDMYFLGAGTGFNCQGDLSDWYSGSGWAPGKWLDADFDAMFDELIGTVDPEKREELCYELQEYMHDEVPLIFLYFQVDYYGVSNRLDWTPEANERIYIYKAAFAE
jgi:peptide/nickel transport system substrate-binding protein